MVEGCPPEQQISNHNKEEIRPEEASTSGEPWTTPKITWEQTALNCWQVVLTEEERELIDEFLET